MGLTFVKEVPAQVKTNKGRSARIVAQLAANPGEWAVAYRMASRSLATSRASALRKLGAEVTTRTESGKIFVYARVNGPVKAKRKGVARGVKVSRPRKAKPTLVITE